MLARLQSALLFFCRAATCRLFLFSEHISRRARVLERDAPCFVFKQLPLCGWWCVFLLENLHTHTQHNSTPRKFVLHRAGNYGRGFRYLLECTHPMGPNAARFCPFIGWEGWMFNSANMINNIFLGPTPTSAYTVIFSFCK